MEKIYSLFLVIHKIEYLFRNAMQFSQITKILGNGYLHLLPLPISFQSVQQAHSLVLLVLKGLCQEFEARGAICSIEESSRGFQFSHSMYIRTVGSQRLLSTLLSPNLSVYGPFWQSIMQSTLDFCPRPARKETSVPLHKRS